MNERDRIREDKEDKEDRSCREGCNFVYCI